MVNSKEKVGFNGVYEDNSGNLWWTSLKRGNWGFYSKIGCPSRVSIESIFVCTGNGLAFKRGTGCGTRVYYV